ncbi:Protein TFG [Thelohanellus kitauei]|uniref:Protein TFG n=1 Tax=Thelohanellus kitauei TaxID=669202 RepID=A0A0C2JRI3_THEKT|nr:Protein TFG [Thelohanellus kitauei]
MSADKFLVFKVTRDGETRNVPVTNEELTFDDFLLMMERVFQFGHNTSSSLRVRYLDEDKDWVTISTNEELRFALSTHDTLKIDLSSCNSPKLSESPLSIDSQTTNVLVSELTQLRTALDSCISKLSQLQFVANNSKINEQGKLAESFSRSVDIGAQPPQKSEPPPQRMDHSFGGVGDPPRFPMQPPSRGSSVKPSYPDGPQHSAPYPQPHQGFDQNRARPQLGYEPGLPAQRLPIRPDIISAPSQISTMDTQVSTRADAQYPRDQGPEKSYTQQQIPPPYAPSTHIGQRPLQQNMPPSMGYQAPMMRPQYPYNPQMAGQYSGPPSGQPRMSAPPIYGYAAAPRTSEGPSNPQNHHQ